MSIQQPRVGRKRGPKTKVAPNLAQLTVRMDPKLRFAVELMARANHQSLGQAVEWSIRNALNTVKVNSCGTLQVLVERVWHAKTPFERLWRTWKLEPNLLTFEERSMMRLVNQAEELLVENSRPLDEDDKRIPDFAFIDKHFVHLQELANFWAEMGYTHGMPNLKNALKIEKRAVSDIAKQLRRKPAKEVSSEPDVVSTDEPSDVPAPSE